MPTSSMRSSEPVGKRSAVFLLLVLTLLNVLNFADRYLIISFSHEIIPELGLSNFQFGLLTGLFFTTVYTLCGLFAGSLADRYDRTYVIGCGLMIWSVVTAVTGLTRNFMQIALARIFVGVGEASLTPAAVSMLGDAFPPARHALVSGIYYMGLPVGIGGSFLFAAAVGDSLGWRGAFVTLGGVGMGAALLLMLLMPDPAGRSRWKLFGRRSRLAAVQPLLATEETVEQSIADKPPQKLADSLRALQLELRDNRAFVWALVGATALTFVGGAGVLDLLWWINERGYEAARAQTITGAIFLVGGTAGAVLGGVGADWAYRKLRAGRLKFAAWISLFSLPLFVAYRLVPGDTPAFYALAFGSSVLSMLIFGPLFSVVQELVAEAHRAAAIALFLLCVVLIGAGGGSALIGYLSDLFAANGYVEPITYAALCLSGAYLIAIAAFFTAARHHMACLPEAASLEQA